MNTRSAKNNRIRRHLPLLLMLLGFATWSFSQSMSARSGPDTTTAAPAALSSPSEKNVPTGQPSSAENYVIGPGDVLAINVWKEPDVSKLVPVRSDGRISLPLAGELRASGKTPKSLEQEITAKLQSYISEPEVTVIVQEIKSQRFNILGQVTKPGTYLLMDSTTVLDAIAMAGGFRDFAKRKSIYVLRTKSDGSKQRLPFNYNQVIKGESQGQNITLEPHDTVVVP
jgi:polysaccharide biosynthesis/export protein